MDKDLTYIIILDSIALVVMFYTWLTTFFMFKEKNKETRLIKSMIIINFVSIILDLISNTLDASFGLVKANPFNTVMIFATCSILRLTIIAGIACWDLFMVIHLCGKINREKFVTLNCFIIVGLVCTIINIFYPFVFKVEDSVYSRVGMGYWIFAALTLLIFLDTMVAYIVIRIKGGMLKFFPIWLFTIPIFLAIIVQSFLPKTSLVWLGSAISINAVIMALQNETIFRDRLTKLYNRVFLDLLKQVMEKSSRSHKFTAMMLDLNGFKHINDQFGHSVGDEALVHTSELLREAVGAYGSVIRFAGDEFVVILNTQDDALIKKIVKNIDKVFDTFNKSNVTEYDLSISLGYSKVDLKNSSVDDIMKEIDEKMYIDKQKKHKEHPEWDR